ncbi:MAG: alpha-L-fucosidase [Gemmatimonadales bacterium]|jgi:alpha-L-fucosidase
MIKTPAICATAVLIGGGVLWQEVPPPRPLLPIPTARQLEWQRKELAMFLHFGVNTFSDAEWGTGDEDPDLFDPSRLDARQWARVAAETGFRTLILTAKHHDGFALWPSRYTEHSVRSSVWRGGRGDVVRELVDAARARGLDVGLYLSPWDRHEPSYGDEAAYNAFYLRQLRELLGDYGRLTEVWFDGAKGPDAVDMEYDFEAYWSLVRQLQPGAVIFSDEGPDVRWIGNERGFAGETNWSMIDRSRVHVGNADTGYLNAGDPLGPHWVPGECDVSIRPGWFWHADQEPKSLEQLLDIYFKSVGRNCVLLLNVPPSREGLLDAADVERLYELRAALDAIFGADLAAGARASASNVRGGSGRFEAARALDGDLGTYWATDDSVMSAVLELELGAPTTFNVVRIQEPVQLGQRIGAYRFQVERAGDWITVNEGTTVGHKKLDRIECLTARRVRLVIDEARAHPLIAELGVHYDPGR